jgi:type IV pilus assembly protein PilM
MFKIGKKLKETVALDIGSHSIKVVSVLKKPDKALLTAYNIKKIQPSDNRSLKTGKSIKEALSEIDLHPAEVNLSVSGANVIVRFITFPKMSKEQMENAMVFEAERYIPFSVNEVILDFAILDAAESGQVNVILAAAKRDFVQAQTELIEKLGMAVNVIDINVFSIFNAFTAFKQPAQDKGTAFFDFGFSQTSVVISVGGIPRFMRLIQIGGKDISAAIAEDLGIPFEEAEDLKVKNDPASRERITLVTAGVLDELIKEIQLSLGYFENKSGKAVGEVYCSGGVTSQEGVLGYFKEKIGIEFKTWDPIGGLDVAEHLSKEAIAPVAAQLAVGIGLTLRD